MTRSHLRQTQMATFFVLAVAALGAPVPVAQAQDVLGRTAAPTIRQLTPMSSPPNPEDPRISDDGSTVVYAAAGNVFAVMADGTGWRQLTDAVGGSCLEPVPNLDGRRVAMSCSANVTGLNPDGNVEIVLLDGTTFLATTESVAPAQNGDPAINADGRALAFLSTANYAGANPDGSREVFLWRAGQPLEQITRGTEEYGFVLISGDGNLLLFGQARENGGTNQEPEQAVFLHDLGTGQTTELVPGVSITNGAASRDLNWAVFETTADLGGNPRSALKLYLLPVRQTPRLLYEVPAGCRTGDLTTNGDASRIVATFVDCGPALLFRPDGVQPLPWLPLDADGVQLDVRGRRLIFLSAQDLTGDNPAHRLQVFVAEVAPVCVGDCRSDGAVAVDELLLMVNVAFDTASVGACDGGDANDNGEITVDEVVLAANYALTGCPARSRMCGGIAGLPCGAEEVCDLRDPTCALADLAGVCVPRPGACTEEFDPVCGCDGVTYANDCFRLSAGATRGRAGRCGEEASSGK